MNKTKKKGCYEMNAVLFSKIRIGLAVPPVVPTELPGSAAGTLRIETEDAM